jgi:serine phosphatase RsbU (regulator of sigma subunit)
MAIQTRTSQVSEQMSEDFMAATTRDERHLDLLRELQFTSYMCIPLATAEEVLGAVTLVSAGSGRRFGQPDLAIAEELAGHAAAVVDRARHHDREKQTVRALQDAFIPGTLPQAQHLEMAAAYLPAKEAAVGGDWYDVFAVQDGSCICIGDVAGHGLHSVAVMAQLRNAVRAYATDDPAPDRVMTRLNRMLCSLEPDETATAIIATWDPSTRMLYRANAGHPPLLRCRPGEFGYLPESIPGLLLGADNSTAYSSEPKLLRPGTTLVFYTDGLIETRHLPIGQSMEQLLDFAESLPDLSPTVVCDSIINWRLEQGRLHDDTCLLAVRLT